MDSVHVTEEWRPVEGWPYEVSSLARVRRTARGCGTWIGRILKPTLDPLGYAYVPLGRAGERWRVGVAPLVCAAFNGPKPSPGLGCRHLDGDPSNNLPSNLAWGTQAENIADRERHGRTARGERGGRCRLLDVQVAAIRDEYAEVCRGRKHAPAGWLKSTAERYTVSVHLVQNITRRGHRA